MSDRIKQDLTQVFHDVFADDTIVLHRELSADQVEGWDSLTHVRLLLTAERKFGVRITAAEAGQLNTVGDLIDLLQTKVNKTTD
jgi:acyl carrier protein